MAKYINGKETPSYDSIMKQKAEDTKKALHKQKKEEDAEAADKAMQEEVDKEADAQKELEKTALENNGQTIESRDRNKALQEGDETATAIEDAKVEAKKPVENAEAVEQIASEAKIEEDEIPEKVKADLEASDEGQQAQAAVDNNDPAALQNITDPSGETVLKGTYDNDGVYVAHSYSRDEAAKLQNKGWAGAATIISIALSALGAVAGIPIMPINFYSVLGTDKYVDKLNENEQNYAAIVNGGKKEANETIRTREATQESNLSDIDAYKDLEDADVQKTAQVNAATQGANATLDVQREQQAWQSREAELDRDFQKVMNQLNTDSQIAILKQQAINQQDLATLMNDLEAQRIMKKIAYAKEAGLTPDETAKWLRAEQGITQFGAAMGYAGDAAKVAGEIANTFIPGGSDKEIKKFAYDGKAANSKMFSSKRKFW